MYWGKSLVKANLVEDFSMFFLDVLSSVKRYTRKARGFYLSIWLALPSYEVLHNSGTLPQHRAKLGHRRLDKYLQLSKQPSRRGTGTYRDKGTGKYFSEALILALTNPQYYKNMFMKIASSEHAENMLCTKIIFILTFSQIYFQNSTTIYDTCSLHVLSLQFS